MLIDPPQNVQEAVVSLIMKDLEPSALTVHTRIGLATVLGGFVSLMFCGQFGFGVTSWAEALSHRMHSSYGSVTCAVACGIMYAAFPIIVLRLLTSPMLFRVLVKRHQATLLMWFAVFGGTLITMGEHGRGVLEYGSWLLAALAAANGAARLAEQFAPTWTWSALPTAGRH